MDAARAALAAMWIAAVAAAGCGDESAVGVVGDAQAAQQARQAETAQTATDATAGAWPSALVGVWRDCSGDLTLQGNGQLGWVSLADDCTASGTWTAAGGAIAITVGTTTPSCGSSVGWLRGDLSGGVVGDSLILAHPSFFNGNKRFNSSAIDRQRWLLTAKPGSAVMDLCCSASGAFFDGHFTSPSCGFLACSGNVNDVKRASQWHIWTQCQGQCPCAAVLVATSISATALAGTWSIAHCGGSDSGGWTAIRQPFPAHTP